MIAILAIASAVTALIYLVYKWVEGIDHMHQEHFDYKGEDFLE